MFQTFQIKNRRKNGLRHTCRRSGPSCSLLEQIPNFNVIHVRFVVASNDSCPWEVDSSYPSISSSACVPSQKKRSQEETASLPNPKLRAKETSTFPKSLSVLEMLKLGTVIKDKSTPLELFEFDVHFMTWSTSGRTVNFVVDKKVLGAGGFREVFKATSDAHGFADSAWVVKRYLPEAITIIGKTNQSVMDHTKKVVQMHILDKNFAEQLTKKLQEDSKIEQYGQTLKYRKIFMAQPGNIVVEQFVAEEFVKFLNNTGSVCAEDSELRQKAESLTHFSYEKSDEQLMIVDVQGCGYELYDPEIASREILSDQSEQLMFAVGNLTTTAIDTFVAAHSCNKYCKLLALPCF